MVEKKVIAKQLGNTVITKPCFFNIQNAPIPSIEDDTPAIIREKYLNNSNILSQISQVNTKKITKTHKK